MAVRLSEALPTPKEQPPPSLRTRDGTTPNRMHRTGGVSRCIPLLQHFEINERKEWDPEVLTFSLLQTRTNFGDLGDPGCSKKVLQSGTSIRFAPCPWSFHVAPEQALEWVSTFKKPSIKDIHNTICATPSPNSIFRIPCLLLNLLPFPPPYCAKVISEESARIQRDHLGNFC